MPRAKAKRHWTVDAVDEETGEVDRGAVMEALADAEAIAYRMGDAVQVTPLREVIVFGDGHERAVTRAVRFDVYGVPARKVDAAEFGAERDTPDSGEDDGFGPGPVVPTVGEPHEVEVDLGHAPEAEPDIPVEPEPSVEQA